LTLNRIEFRRIGRKIFDRDLTLQRIEELAYQFASMCRQAIPDHQQRSAQMLEQMGEEDNRFLFAHGFVEDLEIEVPESQAAGDRYGLPVEVILQHRRFPAGSPRAAAVRALAQSAFVDEDDRPAFFLGFFLMAGQVLRFHSTMASSFRSSARPFGRCGLQFNWRSNFQTWPA
jgi:hypothetical protein